MNTETSAICLFSRSDSTVHVDFLCCSSFGKFKVSIDVYKYNLDGHGRKVSL